MKVTLVLDASYGENLAALDPPVWVCDSPVNRLVAERLWAKPNRHPMAVTVFKRVSESVVQICADVIPIIDEHHPGWTQIAVIGALAASEAQECFALFAPGQFLEGPAGFTFVRSPMP